MNVCRRQNRGSRLVVQVFQENQRDRIRWTVAPAGTGFETRIGIEREFLTRVNGVFGQTEPLAGMTRGAINSWCSRAQQQGSGDVDILHVARILIEVSMRADLLADNSKDVFEPDQRPAPDSLSELCIRLDRALATVRAGSNEG